MTPAAKRTAVALLVEDHEMSERRACHLVGADRAMIRYRSRRPDDAALRERMRVLARERRRFGYRRLHVLLRREGLVVNRKKTQRLYREEGLAVRRRKSRRRIAVARTPIPRPEGPNSRWSVDFVHDQLANGRRFRVLNIIDDVTKECLAAVADTSLSGKRVVRELEALIAGRGKPSVILLDNVLCGREAGARDLFAPEHSGTSCSLIQAASAVKEAVSTIANPGSGDAAPTVLNTRSKTRRKTRTLSTGSRSVPTALSERGPPAWHRPLEEGTVIDAAFDDRMRSACHLGGDRRERLAAEIGVVPVPRNVALELGSEAVVALADRDLPGHPEGTTKALHCRTLRALSGLGTGRIAGSTGRDRST